MPDLAVLARFEPIVRDVFDEFDGAVTPELAARDVTQWDSLGNVQFMVMIERAFGVRFTTAEIGSLRNLGELSDLVAAKTARAG